MTAKKKIGKSAEQVAMEDALEVVLERADWVQDRMREFFSEEYDVDEVVQEWVGENAETQVYEWLEQKYDDEGPDGAVFKQIVQDACQKAVKQYMTEQIMLMLLDEVRANMGKLLGRAMKDYMNEVNQAKE